MHFIGTTVINGVAYAVYSALEINMKKAWADHMNLYGDIVLCDDQVRLVDIAGCQMPEHYNDLPKDTGFEEE